MVNSDTFMLGLILAYAMIAVLAGLEGNWPRAWYWLAAAQITTAVLLMK